MAEVTSSTSVDVTWNPPSMLNGIITHYEVNYTRNDVIDAALQMTNTPGAATMVQLSDLDIFANYTITVRGFTVALGDASSPVTVTTNEGGKCSGVWLNWCIVQQIKIWTSAYTLQYTCTWI